VKTDSLRKQVVYSFLLKDPGHESLDIENSRGGGVVNVAAFLLTIVIQLLLDPKARTFILDERFAHVSARFVPNIGELLQELAQRMKIQVLLITHQPELAEAADLVYHFTKSRAGETTLVPEVPL
jgi:DNA repair ATPase RecN